MFRRSLSLMLALVLAALIVAPASAHKYVKKGPYECWLSQSGQYANRILKIKAGGNYVWMWDDGTDKKTGTFTHNDKKLSFTGALKNQGFRGKHDAYTDSFGVYTHIIYLFKGESEKYNCNLN